MTDFSEMESLGEEKVRLKLASLEWEGIQALRAREWLELRNSAKSDEALLIARRANTIAIIAVIIAVIAIIFAK